MNEIQINMADPGSSGDADNIWGNGCSLGVYCFGLLGRNQEGETAETFNQGDLISVVAKREIELS